MYINAFGKLLSDLKCPLEPLKNLLLHNRSPFQYTV
jgi:hypothetical protein